MSRTQHQRLARDSLELASLASSDHDDNDVHSIPSSPSGAPSSRRLSLEDEDPLHNAEAQRRARAGSTYSVTSAFDFAQPLFPLSTSANGYTALGDPSHASLGPSAAEAGQSLEKHKTLTYLNGLSLVIGIIIGSGIFSSPGTVNINAGSPGASLIVWTVAGVLAWTGAASYAELGGAIPLNGGAQVYLSKIFGEAVGFLFSFFTVSVLKPGSAAIIAIIFGEYLVRSVIGSEAHNASPWLNKGAAVGGLLAVTLLNCVSTKVATKASDFLMLFKFVGILGVSILGIVVAATGLSYDGRPSHDWKTKNWFEGTNSDLSNIAVAIYAGLWSYDGWDNVNYVTGEFINPARDVPRVIHTAIPVVIVSYLLANVAYFLVLPLRVSEGSNTIALAFGHKALGPVGSVVLALLVCGSSFGALNASTFTSGRLFYSSAREKYLPAIFGTLGPTGRGGIHLTSRTGGSSRRGRGVAAMLARICTDDENQSLFMTPVMALLLNFVMTAAYIIVGTFDVLITFYGVAAYMFYFLVVLGLIVLRVREPHLERPYRCWITTPIIFCCVSLFLLSRSVFARPWAGVAVVGFLVAGLAMYGVRMGRSSGKGHGRQSSIGWKFWKR